MNSYCYCYHNYTEKKKLSWRKERKNRYSNSIHPLAAEMWIWKLRKGECCVFWLCLTWKFEIGLRGSPGRKIMVIGNFWSSSTPGCLNNFYAGESGPEDQLVIYLFINIHALFFLICFVRRIECEKWNVRNIFRHPVTERIRQMFSLRRAGWGWNQTEIGGLWFCRGVSCAVSARVLYTLSVFRRQ